MSSFEGTGTTSYVPPALNPFVSGQDYHYIGPPECIAFVQCPERRPAAVHDDLQRGKGRKWQQHEFLPPGGGALYNGLYQLRHDDELLEPQKLPGAYAGTVNYNNKSLADPSIFNFYDNLIDGPNKQEWQNWKAFNVTVDQSVLNGRIAVQGIIDHQEFDSGSVDLYGYTEPFISVDLDAKTIQYPSWYPSQAVANSNEGRAFTASDTGSGASSAHYDHDNTR